MFGAEDGVRTRDLNLGKVARYQLRHFRSSEHHNGTVRSRMVWVMLAELPPWMKFAATRLLEALLALLVVEVLATAFIPAVLGLHQVVITDTSMAPAIAYGSLAYEQPAGQAQLNSVITFAATDGTVVTHRVTAIQSTTAGVVTGYVTRGDANDANDADLVRPDQLQGIVTANVSGFGTVQRVLDVTAVKVFLGAVLVLLLLIAAPGRRKAAESTEPG